MSFSYGGVGGIRTLGPLLTATRFPVVLVMTTSILLQIVVIHHLLYAQHRLLYQLFSSRQEVKFKKCKNVVKKMEKLR